ncbi:hypothetical protein QPK87_15440 [Kamptonema cortianum]|nr:hypothetical protein [Oscillatoria laete-virens]MDK3157957.1 hypothetical protein [Kamptonema cortianum]MDL5046082.1 hypothetical protein [Oscillatoria amoena NRMC-F 0135]MDL5052788.1 hypothetical protein [Oscillatoria laete-virens NRMC-F 0139]
MDHVKDTRSALVRIGYDGRVHKTYRGPYAHERFENELRILNHLKDRGCDFVPRVIDADEARLTLVTTNCGARVERISGEKVREVFAELEEYGVRHDDPYPRNITYRMSDGRFCVIDFEFAVITDDPSYRSPFPQEFLDTLNK